ncbi:hypothetical protein Scani_80780 [Streptomyces caniferus]|uniref:Cellulase n=1 Tax=Streptomyces caniferus TaxID=285557 RepID=A0A640SLD9_9ACTN|nr:hypothetical protein Scani_80780 [Streptomyces caniferus]
MDHFEQELARMMRDGQEDTLYEDRHRDRLHAGVRARRRARAAWAATGSVLTAAGLGVGLMVLPSSFAQDGPTGPQRRPGTPAESAPVPSTPRPVPRGTKAPMPTCTSTTRSVPMPTCAPTAGPVPMPTRAPTTGLVPMPYRPSPAEPVPTPTQTPTAR